MKPVRVDLYQRLSNRWPCVRRWTGPLAAALSLAIVGSAWSAQADSDAARVANVDTSADRFLVVDCLLPGQVRKLGARATYVTARRAVKASVSDCEIRGGEYVSYDRGNYSTALSYWLPEAEKGDKAAQTYVGEIYERGLLGKQDFAAAAQWYKKAADQGYSRALINLGALYEQGLGVAKDPLAAINLYRKASGLGALIALDADPDSGSAQAEQTIQKLRQDLEETRRQLDDARKALEQEQAEKRSQIQDLKRQLQQATAEGSIEEVRALEKQLTEREQQLERRNQEVASLERAVETYKNQLAKAQESERTLQDQLARLTRELAGAQSELADKRKAVQAGEKALAAAQADLDKSRQSPTQEADQYLRLELRLRQRELELERQSNELSLLEKQAKSYQEQVAQLNTLREAEKRSAEEDRRQLKRQLAAAEAALVERNRELGLRVADLELAKGELEASKVQIERLQQAAVSSSQDQETLKQLQSQLKSKAAEIDNYKREMAKLELDARTQQERYVALQAEAAKERERIGAQYRDVQLQLAKTQAELSLSSAQVDRRKTEQAAALKELETTRAELERVRAKAASAQDQASIAWLQAQVEEKQKQISGQASSIALLEKQAKSYQDQVAQLQAAREEERRRSEEERGQLRQQVARLQGQVAAKDAQLEAQRSQLSALQKNMESAQAEIAKLEKASGAAGQERDHLKRLRAQYDQLKAEVAQQTRLLAQTEQENKSYQQLLTKLQAERDQERVKADSDRRQLEQQLAKIQDELGLAQRDLDKRRAEAAAHEKTIDGLRAEAQVARRKTANPQAQESAKRLEAQLKQLEGENASRAKELEELRQVAEAKEIQIAQLRLAREEDARALQLELSRAQGQLSAAQSELAHARASAADSQRQVTQARADLDKINRDVAAKDSDKLRLLEVKLKAREDDLARQGKLLARLESDAKTAQDTIGKLNALRDNDQRSLEAARKDLQQQVGAAQAQMAALTKDLESARARAGESDRALVAALSDYDRAKKAATSSNKDSQERLAQAEAKLAQRESELSRGQKETQRLERETKAYQERLGRLLAAQEAERLRFDDMQRQLAQSEGQLAATQAELARRKAESEENQRAVAAAKEELARMSKKLESVSTTSSLALLKEQLREREEQLTQQRVEVDRLDQLSKQLMAKLTAASTPASKGAKKSGQKSQVAVAAPTIHLIDPPVVVVRSPIEVKVRGGVSTRAVVGRVSAPAGLLSFTVNDRVEKTDANGLFTTTVQVSKVGTPVSLVAVDQQGKRTALDFSLVPEEQNGAPTAAKVNAASLDTGDYYAIVIGNREYKQLVKLDTAVEDAKAVGNLLAKRYKFKVTTLINATRYQILSELNKARAKLTEKDNLLIYYAGHGELDKANLRAHWLPVDAEPGSDANWISSIAITDILNAMAPKHVLVVADSCYSGAMTRASIGQLESGMSDETRVKWLSAIAQAKSRTVLTSGGVQPVLDGGGGKHSVFAKIFIDVLTQNSDVLEGQRLFREVSARVLDLAQRTGKFDQRPEYAPLKFAGHESGDFLFLPVN